MSKSTGKSDSSDTTRCRKHDYSSVEIPEKDPTEYTYMERRAELLQLIEEAGHPGRVNQTQMADKYGVSQQQISKDIDRIGQFVHDRVGQRERRAFHVVETVERSIRGLLDEGDYRGAAKTAIEYDDWLRDFSEFEQLKKRIQQIEEMQEKQKL